jgi:hypothetical protein
MDAGKQRLFIGCRKPQKLIVMSTQDGKVEASLPIGAGVDATAAHEGQAFASCRDGSLVVSGEKAGKMDVVEVAKTPVGARTMDSTLRLIRSICLPRNLRIHPPRG